MKTLIRIAAPIAVLGLVACGGATPSATPSGAPSAQPTSSDTPSDPGATSDSDTTTDTSSTTQSVAAGSGPSVSFTYVNPDGWHYTGILTWPAVTFAFTKDISSSPPGYAELKETLTLPPEGIGPQTFPNNDAGRPNGPTMEVAPGRFGWRVADVAHADPQGSFGTANCISFGPPSANTRDGTDTPKTVDFQCEPVTGVAYQAEGATQTIGSNDRSEKAVDRFLAALAPAPFVWIALVRGDSCPLWIYSDGHTKKAPSWDDGYCGKFTVK